jgi:hypothetical protein
LSLVSRHLEAGGRWEGGRLEARGGR